MKINHEVTKSAKIHSVLFFLRFLRFFVVDFRRNTMKTLFRRMVLLLNVLILASITYAQGTLADYERSNNLRPRFQGLAVNIPDRANWIERTSRFWYRKSVKGGNEFTLVDVE